MEILGLQSGYRHWHKGTSENLETPEPLEERPSLDLGSAALDLAAKLLSSLECHVLSGDPYADLAEKISHIKYRLAGPLTAEVLNQMAPDVESVLKEFQSRVHDASSQTALDFKRVLSLVNESFSRIQIGDLKSDERLKYFEKSLRQASKMDSLVTLRRHLSEMLEFVRSEGRADQAENEVKLQSMKEQIQQAQTATARLRVQVPGRPEALEYMGSLINSKANAAEYTVALFVVDALKPLRARHGEEIASSLLDELSRRIQPLAPQGRIFWWTNSALALVSRPANPGSSAGVMAELPTNFEHRAFIGNRVATFKVSVRSISTCLNRGLKEITSALDGFSKERLL